ncbi:glycoside hydrolase family 130 protein [bacterium]|nr:glycoside hydrolase family 130 protein [bacterium]MBU1072642.1 glycoside hydrolase family 130 protein [bacterium]MBU1676477.1 glycoside hydrolase family 130 protein [bacterium]
MTLKRITGNPILDRADIPDIPPAFVDVSSVFNPGAARVDGRVLLLLRVQSRGRETGLVRAWSHDGIRFRVENRLVEVRGLEDAGFTAHHVYDPRLTVVDGELVCTVAIDTDDGCRLGTGRLTGDGVLRLAGVSPPDVRNGVVFPERVDGSWLRLERPNRTRLAGGPVTGDTITLSASDDLSAWREVGEVMRGRPRSWDEMIGPGTPPIKTREGWLLLYHGIATHFQGNNLYQAGAVLLDLTDPTRVVARTRRNVLEPRAPYELSGQVPNVVFPTGWICDAPDGEGFAPPDADLKVYYGAADTVVGLAVGTVRELLGACRDAD